jgi:transposase
MAYSIDYKKRAVEYKNSGHTFNELKEAFDIPPVTYYDWKQKLGNGYYQTEIIRERKRKIDKEKLKQAVKENPDAYLYELARLFDCTPQAVFYMLEKLNITLKKRPLLIRKSPKSGVRNLRRG